MSLDNAAESATIDMLLKGTDPSWRAGATAYAALIQGAENEAAPMTGECNYTGYARIPLTKASAYSGTGATRSNANQLQWGKRTDAGATQTATHVIICDTPSGAVNMAILADMVDDLDISLNITPIVAAGDLTITVV
jgi:hypothetical protein